MKQHIYIITSALIIASSLIMQAQITLTQAANSPIPGDINVRKPADTTNALPNSITGNPITWNFTGLQSDTTSFTETWVNPSTLPGTFLFTSLGANVVKSDSTTFMKSSSTKLEYMGDMFANGAVQQFTNTIEVMRFPFSYANSYTDNFSGYSNSPNGNINITGSLTVTADGEGTLILPTDPTPTNYAALRVKTNMSMNIAGTGTLSFLTGTITVRQYQFFTSGRKSPILNYSYNIADIPLVGINNDTTFSMDHDASIILNVNTISNNTPYLFIFPNPTSKYLNIQTNTLNTYKIQVMNMNGQIIYEDELNHSEQFINTEFWSNGTYIIQLINEKNNQKLTHKFVKE